MPRRRQGQEQELEDDADKGTRDAFASRVPLVRFFIYSYFNILLTIIIF